MTPETCNSPDTSSNISGTEEAQAVNVDRQFMGTPDAAKAALLERAREWREYRQPSIGSANEHRRVDALEREARFQLANAALLWLWHEENPLPAPALPQDVAVNVEPSANSFFADDEFSDEFDTDTGRPGKMLVANAIQFWSTQNYNSETKRFPSVRETAVAFKMTDADVRTAVEAHCWMFLEGPNDDPTQQLIEHEGE